MRDGWDVWLGNNRGTRFSDKKEGYTQENSEYWNFDWSDMGARDVPAMADYIINWSDGNYPKISYLGYSQGTAQFFYGLATHGDLYRDKIHMYAGLAPCTRMKHSFEESKMPALLRMA